MIGGRGLINTVHGGRGELLYGVGNKQEVMKISFNSKNNKTNMW